MLFGYPLRAGHPSDPANKVLWIVRLPRGGSALSILATPARARGPLVRVEAPDNAGPGEIYPSYVNVPAPGCWHLSLHWAGHSDAIDLVYQP